MLLPTSTVMQMEAALSPLVNFHQTARRHIPKENTLRSHCSCNLKPRNWFFFMCALFYNLADCPPTFHIWNLFPMLFVLGTRPAPLSRYMSPLHGYTHTHETNGAISWTPCRRVNWAARYTVWSANVPAVFLQNY
jgi:hypothetical protein